MDRSPDVKTCTDEDCHNKDKCPGNTIVEVTTEHNGASSSTANKAPWYRLIVTHAKTSRSWDGLARTVDRLPDGLAILIQRYLLYARPLLVSQSEFYVSSFLVTRFGQNFDYQSLRQMWLDIQDEFRVPWVPFAPRHLRHIFADHIFKDALQAAGALPEGGVAALRGSTQIMGNSPATLLGHYAQRADLNAIDAAISRVAVWRLQEVPKVRARMSSVAVGYNPAADQHNAGAPRTPAKPLSQRSTPSRSTPTLRGTGGAVSISVARLLNIDSNPNNKRPLGNRDTAGGGGTAPAPKRSARVGADQAAEPRPRPHAVQQPLSPAGTVGGPSPRSSHSGWMQQVQAIDSCMTNADLIGTTGGTSGPNSACPSGTGQDSKNIISGTTTDGSTPAAHTMDSALAMEGTEFRSDKAIHKPAEPAIIKGSGWLRWPSLFGWSRR